MDIETLVGDGTVEGAARAQYEAYWLGLNGKLNGVDLPNWVDLGDEQKDALIDSLTDLVTYFNDNEPA